MSRLFERKLTARTKEEKTCIQAKQFHSRSKRNTNASKIVELIKKGVSGNEKQQTPEFRETGKDYGIARRRINRKKNSKTLSFVTFGKCRYSKGFKKNNTFEGEKMFKRMLFWE